MITHTFTRGWTNGGGSISKRVEVQAGEEINIDESIPASSTNALVAFVLDVSQCKGLFLVCDKAVTVKTNSGGSPINTFTLVANTPFAWAFGDAALRDTAGVVVTTDITALYVTNADPDNAALLEIRCLVDPTV